MKYLLFFLLSFTVSTLSAQLYLDHHTRHRLAQLNLGLDLQYNTPGTTYYKTAANQIQVLQLPSINTPRFLIGGTHFWGHADFYISIPLYNPTFSEANQEIQYTSSVETVFKYYPLPKQGRERRAEGSGTTSLKITTFITTEFQSVKSA